MNIPEELDFIEFFNDLPIKDEDDPSLLKFQITDANGVSLLFILSEMEDILHFALRVNDTEIVVLNSESIEAIQFVKTKMGRRLEASFAIEGCRSVAMLRIHPNIHLDWHAQRDFSDD